MMRLLLKILVIILCSSTGIGLIEKKSKYLKIFGGIVILAALYLITYFWGWKCLLVYLIVVLCTAVGKGLIEEKKVYLKIIGVIISLIGLGLVWHFLGLWRFYWYMQGP